MRWASACCHRGFISRLNIPSQFNPNLPPTWLTQSHIPYLPIAGKILFNSDTIAMSSRSTNGAFGMGFSLDPKSHIPNSVILLSKILGFLRDFCELLVFFSDWDLKILNYFPVQDWNFPIPIGSGFFFLGWEIPQKSHF